MLRRLDNIYKSKIGDSVPSSKSGCYIAMFDIDNLIISGSLASCEGYDDVNLIMHNIDSLLYKAKKDGKNQIKV
ncbi:MAG: hypothetical protein IJ763_09275 [Lachnospiraceae bacterium]|nr:hypothetical protein [Lachnospiraceae bacterium]